MRTWKGNPITRTPRLAEEKTNSLISMRKLLVFLIVLLVVFVFRDHLNRYWVSVSSHIDEEEPMGWVAERSESLYNDLPQMDFESAIASLEDFERSITISLARLDETAEDEQSRRRYSRNLICELAVVYRKMATVYLNRGEDELYIRYMEKSRQKLAECSELKE